MAITLTSSASERVRHYLANEGGQALRLGVRRTGCSGWAYTVDLASEVGPEDAVFETDGVKVVVDPDSLPLIDGTSVDFVTDGLNRTFRFDNPNVSEACGCGESFTVG